MSGGLPGTADRAAAAVRALARARDDAAAAADLLARAGAVDWTGPGAAGYRDELAVVLATVRRAVRTLEAAGVAAADHTAALRETEERGRAEAAVGWSMPGGGPVLGPAHPGDLGPRTGPWPTR